jgi:hypothetical protein
MAAFASAVGEKEFWVRDPVTVCDPNHEMPLAFGSPLLEIALSLKKSSTSNTRTTSLFGRVWMTA